MIFDQYYIYDVPIVSEVVFKHKYSMFHGIKKGIIAKFGTESQTAVLVSLKIQFILFFPAYTHWISFWKSLIGCQHHTCTCTFTFSVCEHGHKHKHKP